MGPEKDDTPEVEITPAMIEAGHNEMVSYNHDYECPEEAVVRIFRAMWDARPDSFPAE